MKAVEVHSLSEWEQIGLRNGNLKGKFVRFEDYQALSDSSTNLAKDRDNLLDQLQGMTDTLNEYAEMWNNEKSKNLNYGVLVGKLGKFYENILDPNVSPYSKKEIQKEFQTRFSEFLVVEKREVVKNE